LTATDLPATSAWSLDSLPPNLKALVKKPSAASQALGTSLVAYDQSAGWVDLAFAASDSLLNKWGAVQGGMVAAMLDDALSLVAGLNLDWGQIVPTLEIKVSYVAPARPGRLLARAEIVKRGKSIIFCEARLTDESGALLATASGTFSVVTLKPKGDAAASNSPQS
jgi:uncharacterized protein (TIGR00369 family)